MNYSNKHILILSTMIMLLGLFISSCSTPQALYLNVEKPDTSSFNLDPSGMNVSIITVPDNTKDSTFFIDISKNVAAIYENEQTLEVESVGVYSIPQKEYSSIDENEYLHALAEKTNSQIFIILSDFKLINISMKHNEIDDGNLILILLDYQVTSKIASISSLISPKKEVIKETITFAVSPNQHPNIFRNRALLQEEVIKIINDNYEEICQAMGEQIASHFSTKWHEHEFLLIDYSDDYNWHNASKLAISFDFDEAIKAWMPYCNDNNSQKASYAAYNIAVCCNMLGKNDLAKEWIVYSLNKYTFSEALEFYEYLKK